MLDFIFQLFKDIFFLQDMLGRTALSRNRFRRKRSAHVSCALRKATRLPARR